MPRRKGYASSISIFVNIEEIRRTLARHGALPAPDQIDREHLGYEAAPSSAAR